MVNPGTHVDNNNYNYKQGMGGVGEFIAQTNLLSIFALPGGVGECRLSPFSLLAFPSAFSIAFSAFVRINLMR